MQITAGTKVRTTYEHSETGTIIKTPKSAMPLPGPDWFVIKFDRDGDRLCIHRSMFNIANSVSCEV